ncbi:hypothetical protein OK409_17075 [Pantoea sp. RG18]|uniref:hypothetical protein n=1 Tax=Pantoea sp. RG18 TaxID=2981603 RepID=UPI00221EBA3D|nr:hypothetical protein [Pantoea sp. RG18]MCW0938441.1 hypothetical protein [Pantoea sp. RG18]
MSFDDSIQQLRNEQLARRSDTERFISVKTLFEQLKQRYPDQSYNALCLLALKKYRRSEHQPSLYWFRYESWYDTSPVAPYQLLDKHGAPNIGAPDYYPNAEAALRAVSDDVMNSDKLADCGFLRSEITSVLEIDLNTISPNELKEPDTIKELQVENDELKKQIAYLTQRLAVPVEGGELYAQKREEFFIAVIASLYDKGRIISSKGALPIATELLELVVQRAKLFWSYEQKLPISDDKCLKMLREAMGWLTRTETDIHDVKKNQRAARNKK